MHDFDVDASCLAWKSLISMTVLGAEGSAMEALHWRVYTYRQDMQRAINMTPQQRIFLDKRRSAELMTRRAPLITPASWLKKQVSSATFLLHGLLHPPFHATYSR